MGRPILAGFTQRLQPTSPEAKESFAVNVATAEGNLAKITEPELRQGVSGRGQPSTPQGLATYRRGASERDNTFQ